MAKKLRYIKKELGFAEGPGLIYGYYGNYMVSFSTEDKEIELFVDAELDENDEETLEKLRTFLKGNAHAYNLTGTAFSPTGISVRTEEKNYEGLLEFFYIFMNQLKLLRVPGADLCSNCGAPLINEHVILKIGNHAHTCDDDCAQKILSSGKAKAANKTNKRVFLGTVGAILISLLSTALYIYLGYAGYPAAPAAFLIPLAATFGFYMFGGKQGVGKLIVCFIVPLIVFAVAALTTMGLTVFQSWSAEGYVFSIKELLSAISSVLKDNELFREQFLYRQVLFGGIFLLAGFVFTLPTAYAKPAPYFAILKDIKDNG